jgi:hypothetical protein
MNLIDYINLLRRNVLNVLLITMLVTMATIGLVMLKNRTPYQTTIFVSIGSIQKNTQGETPVYDNVQAADHFSETVQGWFKNPEFGNRINLKGSTEVSARKQEKQNLLITFSSENNELAKKMDITIKKELENEIETYNTKTNSLFQIAIYTVNTEEKPLSIALFLIISLIGGIVLSSFAIYGYEYLFQKISSPAQARELLQKQPIDQLHNLRIKGDQLNFLRAYLSKTENKTIQIIETGVKTKKLAELLMKNKNNKTIECINFPLESEKISEKAHTVVVCTLGKTTTEDILKLQRLIKNDFDFVIVEA